MENGSPENHAYEIDSVKAAGVGGVDWRSLALIGGFIAVIALAVTHFKAKGE